MICKEDLCNRCFIRKNNYKQFKKATCVCVNCTDRLEHFIDAKTVETFTMGIGELVNSIRTIHNFLDKKEVQDEQIPK